MRESSYGGIGFLGACDLVYEKAKAVSEVQQIMHMCKKSEEFLNKKDRLYLSHPIFSTHSSLFESEMLYILDDKGTVFG